MSERTNFRVKLGKIYEALCEYTEDILPGDQQYILPDIKLRYSILLNAIDDLHFGKQGTSQQADAIKYFKSEDFDILCSHLPIQRWLIDKIIQSPEDYRAHIAYQDTESGVDEEYLYY